MLMSIRVISTKMATKIPISAASTAAAELAAAATGQTVVYAAKVSVVTEP